MLAIVPLLSLLGLLGCPTTQKTETGNVDECIVEGTFYADADGDGFGDANTSFSACTAPTGYVEDSSDCDDSNAAINTAAQEACDGVDNDCDGSIDDGVLSIFYADTDDDGFGNEAAPREACEQPEGHVPTAGDCDDTNGDIYPNATEVCDFVDNDCDGSIDEDVSSGSVWYLDSDGDGFGTDTDTQVACGAPSGYVSNDDDCDDGNPRVNPDATEFCNEIDDDCDGTVDEEAMGGSTWYEDADGDSFGDATSSYTGCEAPVGYVTNDDDCDDTSRSISPGAVETCDDIDNDCDGSVDEAGATGGDTFFADADGDGYGDPRSTVVDCDLPVGYVTNDDDCNDSSATVYPSAPELCDGLDNDCDGSVDESAVDKTTWYADADGDDYGNPAGPTEVACDQPTGYVADHTDCDDMDSLANPGQAEICDDVDNDCDGSVDEYGATGAPSWYQDTDGDGYGNSARKVTQCDAPTGYVSNDDDCDDAQAAANPGEAEICDGIDNDCDGSTDESDATDAATWYQDLDRDGYGNSAVSKTQCTAPSGYVASSGDCDDTRSSVSPAGSEVCDDLDNDCNGAIDDDAADMTTWYVDADADGFGDAARSALQCDAPAGYVADSGDCDDTEPTANPGETEVCDGIDNDCDGSTDEADAADATTWYQDADRDGYGNPTTGKRACTAPSGYIADDSDCDDTKAAINPGASEVCDSIDNDCDGAVDDHPTDGTLLADDGDEDGFGATGSMDMRCSGVDNDLDCLDTDPTEPRVVDADSTATTPDGSLAKPYTAIQDGIDTALACVVVYPGTYTENVDFDGRNVRVRSIEGPDTTIIDGNGSGAAVTFQSGETAEAALLGFTITNGSGHEETTTSSYSCGSGDTCTDHYSVTCGGGIYIDGATPSLGALLVQDNTVTAAADYESGTDKYVFTAFGGGICFRNTSITVADVDLVRNTAEDGGGAFVDSGANVTFQGGFVLANTAEDGGGMQVDGGTLTLTNAVFAFNEATVQGGGVFATGATFTETNVAHTYDDAPDGGGLYLASTTVATVMNTIIWGAPVGNGVEAESTATFSGSYNDVYGNYGGNYAGVTDPTGTSGNVSLYPYFTAVSNDGDLTNDDWTLQSRSPGKNAGNSATAYNDVDGTRNDMGALGGPYGGW